MPEKKPQHNAGAWIHLSHDFLFEIPFIKPFNPNPESQLRPLKYRWY